MTPEEAFSITPDERARLDAAPFRGTDEAGWRAFAGAVHEQVLAAYRDGEVTLERALKAMRSCSLACRLGDRITLMALTADRACGITPLARGTRRPPVPTWVRNSAASLVQMLHDARPDEPVAPTHDNNWTTPILADAIEWLIALGLCERIDARTVYQWYLASKRDQSNST